MKEGGNRWRGKQREREKEIGENAGESVKDRGRYKRHFKTLVNS